MLNCKKKFSCIISVLLFIILYLSLYSCSKKSTDPVNPREKITIAYPRSMYSVLFTVAYKKGYFKSEGLEIIPQVHDFGKKAVQSMIEGKADLAISGDTVVMFAISRGEKISIIVARKDSGINKPGDLEGKRIAVALETTGHFFLDSFLSINGISRNNIRIVNLSPKEMQGALSNGTVDAVAVWQPVAKQIELQLGNNGRVFYDERVYSDIICISSTSAFIHKNSGSVIKILRALINAETFVKDYPEETRRLVSDYLEIDKVILESIWSSLFFKVTLDQSLLVSLEDETRWARENRLIVNRKTPQYLDYIYFNGLQSVKPDAVNIIR
jgi:NitT/TauT family transport system substrate-binding protein